MNVGFTGTREGMTINQRSQFWAWLEKQDCDVFRHGACVGADEQAAVIADRLTPRPTVFAHPCDLTGLVSREAVRVSDELDAPQRPLDRNRTIVDGCDVLAACPKGPEELRSGTWACVRYARRVGRRVVYFWPDGTVTEDAAPVPA